MVLGSIGARCERHALLKIKQVFFIEWYIKFLKELKIFLPERFLLMVLFLVLDIPDYATYLGMRIGKYPVPFLPAKLTFDPAFAINKSIAFNFYFFSKIGDQYIWFESDKNMNMVGHTING